jgi:hypothetical protein
MTIVLKLSKPVFTFLIVVINAANTYLIPLIAKSSLGDSTTGGLQLFLTVVLNGVVVLLATESGSQTTTVTLPGTASPN